MRSEDDAPSAIGSRRPACSTCVDGEHELLPGLRLVPAPGHTPGMQMVVVETGGRPVIVGGDVAVWFGEFDEPPTEGRQRVLALDPSSCGSRRAPSHGDPAPSEGVQERILYAEIHR